MKTTAERNFRPSIRRTILRFSAIFGWFTVMLFASYEGFFIHAYIGILALVVLTFLTFKQAHARANYLKKKRERYISNYHVGEEYLKVFFANK